MTLSKFAGLGLLTTILYIAAARMGLSLAFAAEQVTVVWPPTGIALCAVLLLGYRIWPFIAAGAFIANILTNAPTLASLGIATGNTLEAVVGAWLLHRFVGFRPSLGRFRDVFGLIVLGAVASTTISATIGVFSLCVTGVQPWSQFGPLWGVWFLGDAMGDVLVAPLVLSLACTDCLQRLRARLPEFIGMMVVLVSLDFVVFGRFTVDPGYPSPHYAILPILMWAAHRFGVCGTAIGAFITASIAVFGTVGGYGPFAIGGINESLISLHLFMFIASLAGLLMAVSEGERSRAEGSLRSGQDRYRSLVLASSQAVWSTTANGEVIEDLPTWRAFTGQTHEEILGRGWMRMIHPDDIPSVSETWERSLATRTPHDNEFRVHAADGTYRNVYARTVPVLEPDGTIREWVGTLTDVTEKKIADRELQDAGERKDQFLAMLAHELRNPLGPIRNAVEIIRSSKDDPARIDWACQVMLRQIQHMGRLLDDLLDASRVTRGAIQLARRTTDLTALVERTIEAVRTDIERKDVRLVTDFVPGPVPLFADVTRIEQVVTNLLNNAMKFTPSGGRITVIVDRRDDTAILRVRDTGRGISSELLPHVFDLFTQGDRSLARSEGGLGIGLTLVQTLVQMHSGSVEAKSEGPGKGSEFVVRLPMLPVVP